MHLLNLIESSKTISRGWWNLSQLSLFSAMEPLGVKDQSLILLLWPILFLYLQKYEQIFMEK